MKEIVGEDNKDEILGFFGREREEKRRVAR